MTRLNFITGANGHPGNNLVRTLLANNEKVRASVHNIKIMIPFEGLDCEIVYVDLMDKESLLRALEGVDSLYQGAAIIKHWSPNPQAEIIAPNMQGTGNIMQAAASQGAKRIVCVSSAAALGPDDRHRTDGMGQQNHTQRTNADAKSNRIVLRR